MAEPDEWERLRKAVEGVPGTRSPLHRWLRQNRAEFARLIADSRPNWDRLADAFNGMGLTNGRGEPLVGGTVRQTWWRAKREGSAKRQPTRQPVPQRTPAAQPAPARTEPAKPAEPPGRQSNDDLRRVLGEMSARGRKLPDPL